MRSMPGAMPPCGGAPKRSARSRKPKRSSASAGVDPDHVEHARLQFGAVDADRARGHLEAVQDHVVGLREDGARIALQQLLVLALGRRERMVLRRPAAPLLVLLEEREVDHEEELPLARGDQLEAPREVRSQGAEHALDHDHASAAMNATEPRLRPRGLADRRHLALGEELLDRRAHAPVGLEDEVREPLAAPLLGELGELVVVLARERLGGARDAQAANDATGRDGAREHAELGVRHLRADVADLEAVAQVGLVGAVARERLAVRHARERQLDLVTGIAPDLGHQLLGQREHVLLLDEAHLEVELRELERAVGALRLVPPAAGDLVVAVEAAAHQQLLVELRALRQRIERPRLSRNGITKSRAPSGVARVIVGVSMSRKPRSSRKRRIERTARVRMPCRSCILGRRRSR